MDERHAPSQDRSTEPAGVQPVDLARIAGAGGVVWSVSPEGFHANLVVLEPVGSIAAHRNDALDVLLVVVGGAGRATVDDAVVELTPACALLVPRGSVRSITASAIGLRYLTVHGQRGPLTIGGKSDV